MFSNFISLSLFELPIHVFIFPYYNQIVGYNTNKILTSYKSYLLYRYDQSLLVSRLITDCLKCSNTEFFLVWISPFSDWKRKFTEYISLSSKCGTMQTREKFLIWTFFVQRELTPDLQVTICYIIFCQTKILTGIFCFNVGVQEYITYIWYYKVE